MEPKRGSRHVFTPEERRRGGKKRSAQMWSEHRRLKEKGKRSREDGEMSLGQVLEALRTGRITFHPPPPAAKGDRLLRQQEEARRYAPGVWTDDKREWRRRRIEMGEIMPDGPGEPSGNGQEPPEP